MRAPKPKPAVAAPATVKPRRVRRITAAELEAVEREKVRLSIELHDGVGQHLTGIAFLAKALANRLEAKRAAEADDAEQVVRLTNEAIGKLRALARGLRPTGTEDNALAVALAQLVRDVNQVFGSECLYVADRPVTISNPLVSHHLYRIAQEGIHNAVKHGLGGRITVDLAQKQGAVVLSVTNRGKLDVQRSQAQSESPGIGIAGMQYRAQLLGAELSLEPVRSTVRLRVSIDRATIEGLPRDGEML